MSSILFILAGIIGGVALPKFWDMTVEKVCTKYAPNWVNCGYCGQIFAVIIFILALIFIGA